MKPPLILAIDTSCDETCAAVSYGRQILSNVISSQINIHAKYGGVVPHLAKRAHLEKIEFVVTEALKRSVLKGLKLRQQPEKNSKRTDLTGIDAVAVTVGPGLAPALEVGVNFAKNLAQKLNKPLIAVNHLEGHLLSCLANMTGTVPYIFPAIGLIVSGGHTELVLVKSIGHYQLLGQTLDDAAGEALDKLAKMLQLGYPGGPIIEELAKLGNPDAIKLPVPLQHSNDLNFSFSGLKTAAMYIIQKRNTPGVKDVHTPGVKSSEVKFVYDLCASFQQAIAKSLTTKLIFAIDHYYPASLLLGGGVLSNLYFRRQIRQSVNLPLYLPKNKKLFTDNAAMICIPAYYKFLKKDFVKDISTLDRQPNLNF
ncbi:MAG: tRNA (adenosine(37)-N6)-threonylcarbamoyltransferase complex transferase subunit TsaD [Candidatus Beckwithbacteria bacterium]|nr:tRNA (adenosine(37)-N6)-threonylcarbamoyltransferase complex transferase subunit TsaD [Candidatus Beckwithbacteria bacterium]